MSGGDPCYGQRGGLTARERRTERRVATLGERESALARATRATRKSPGNRGFLVEFSSSFFRVVARPRVTADSDDCRLIIDGTATSEQASERAKRTRIYSHTIRAYIRINVRCTALTVD